MISKSLKRVALLSCVALSLAACETMNGVFSSDDSAQTAAAAPKAAENTVPCPPIHIVEELSMLHQFLDDAAQRSENALSNARITNVKGICHQSGANVVVDMDIAFEGALGPKAKGWNTERPSFAYPYFVAVTTPDGQILAKEIFAAAIGYDKAQQRTAVVENLRQVIPVSGGTFTGSPELMLGFQLTDQELVYNRAVIYAAKSPEERAKMPPVVSSLPDSPPPVKKAPVKKKVVKKPPQPKDKPAAAVSTTAPADAMTAPAGTTAAATAPVSPAAPVAPATTDPAAPAVAAPTAPAPAAIEELPAEEVAPPPTPLAPAVTAPAPAAQPEDLTAPPPNGLR